MTTHYVYELIAGDGSRLYIGCTRNIGQRLNAHHSERQWWPEIARLEVDAFPNERSARDEERRRIEEHAPQFNHVFTDKYNAGGWASRRARIAAQHLAGELCGHKHCDRCNTQAHEWRLRCFRGRDRQCDTCLGWPSYYTVLAAYSDDAARERPRSGPVTRRAS